jgi:hypothetical protein
MSQDTFNSHQKSPVEQDVSKIKKKNARGQKVKKVVTNNTNMIYFDKKLFPK